MTNELPPAATFRRWSLGPVLLLLCALPEAGLAQSGPASPGTLLRLTQTCPAGECRTPGALVRLQGDATAVSGKEATSHIGPDAIAWLQRSQGRRSRWLLGAGIGFVVGAGATHLVLNSGGSTAPCDRSANQDAMSAGECLGLTALGGFVGAGLGALIGGRFRSGP